MPKMAHFGGGGDVLERSEMVLSALPNASTAGPAKTQLSEFVASHLREQIISGALRQGEFLRIDAIAKDLNVSTTPVREGLLLLQNESFVRLMPRRGFAVNGFSKTGVLDLFWAQATFAAELAARATGLMTAQDLSLLEEIQAEHALAAAANDQMRSTKLGHQFHRTINLAAQSPRLALLLGRMTKQLPNRFYVSIEGQLEGAIEYHQMIIDAIRVRDAEAVRTLMHRHILSGVERLIAMLERQGMWTDGEPVKKVKIKQVK